MLTTYLKIQIFVENISTNRIGRPNVYSVIPYNATNNDGNIVREYITIPYYGFSDNFQNEYKTEGLLKKSYYKDGIRPGDNDNWEFNFSRNQSPLDDISFFNVEFKKEIFGKSIILKIPRQMLALRYFPWFLIKLLVCDAVAFFASIEVYGYYPVISTTKNIASSL